MLLPKSFCVYIPCFKSVAPGFVCPKYLFGLFWGPDMNTEIDLVMYMYLKHSPDYINS